MAEAKKNKEPIAVEANWYSNFIPTFFFKVFFVTDDFVADPIGFSEVSGLSVELQTEDLFEGGGNTYAYRLPKQAKPKNIVLKRALNPADNNVIDWAKNCVEKFIIRPLTVIITLASDSENQLKTWNVMGAYAVKLSTTDFNANKSEVVIQTLELTCQSLTEVKPDRKK